MQALARPYPVEALNDARHALASAHRDVQPLQELYRAATLALEQLDPDEVDDYRQQYRRALRTETGLARAAVSLAQTWEGLVVVGSEVRKPAFFRGFCWLAAQVRYGLEPARRDAGQLRRYAQGASLLDTRPEDAALYAALPALIGLGPELPDELEGPCPVPGQPVPELLGLSSGEDWRGIDPLDGLAVPAQACRAHFAAAPPPWRHVLSRCTETGMVVRSD